MKQVSQATFDDDGIISVISATAGQQIKIVGIVIINNDTDEDSQARIRLLHGSPVKDFYGDSTASIMIQGNGGKWGLPMTRDSVAKPYFICDTNTAFLIQDTSGSTRISGIVEYYKE